MLLFFKYHLSLLIAFLIFIPSFSFAVDLNSPGDKKVTIKSEILRGQEAAFSAAQAADSIDLLGQMNAIDRVFSLNKQKNTDSPGFLLGADFGAWSALSMSLELLKGKDYVKQGDYDLVLKFSQDYFKAFRQRQKQMKVSDEKLMETIGFKKPLMDSIYKWDYQTKNPK